ncbi:M23 family metallopeptidase [Chromobacterium subtsugae]|uniref:M23 family metallopeptidase n=2 Tax=Chromobacterium subtsugae TaxID=251747 RepID=A0ABS7FH73_9NEIS|nr:MULTISPECIES: M23 family metallopeptidase [Chromobacterium]KUM04280.1 hypothetical protein Cv017_00555 [Chromobacterium subtsugae]KZE88358.1 hypothetical protein AWB61_00305 [Chromobacterium sp. F49]MBW7568743.1 M23 family metallopeptidase [Chromobacterium subtsugae]MBW8289427.1 M23 family metallopeptidase [Chromobacterium subtsugae]WSE90031.1 M23 family metallopeptidase [Chromobacterium subtsugae]
MKTFLLCFAGALSAIACGSAAVLLSSGQAGADGISLPQGGGGNGGGPAGFCFATPFQGTVRVTSPASAARKHPTLGTTRPHYGDDISLPSNTPIYAPADGVVERVAFNVNNAGNFINLKHPNGYLTRYLHLNSISVKSGQRVHAGDLLGYSGMSGGNNTGPNLHWEAHYLVYKNPSPPKGPTSMLCSGAVSTSDQSEPKQTGDENNTVEWPKDSDAPDPVWDACPIQPPPVASQGWRLDEPGRTSKPY